MNETANFVKIQQTGFKPCFKWLLLKIMIV